MDDIALDIKAIMLLSYLLIFTYPTDSNVTYLSRIENDYKSEVWIIFSRINRYVEQGCSSYKVFVCFSCYT